jgi:hypothetical protein
MRNFTHISYNKEEESLTIGAGLRWGEVFRFLTPYNATVVGGRNVDVGVTGLILGGNSSAYATLC